MRQELGHGHEQFFCDIESCGAAIIPQLHARFHCLSCAGSYDLCVECHRRRLSSGGHQHWHPYQIFRVGGDSPPITHSGFEIQTGEQTHPYWGYMITEKGTPSGHFSGLIQALFDFADRNLSPVRMPPMHKLEPEKCRTVMTMLGYSDEENLFHCLLDFGQRSGLGISWSDAEIGLIYEQYCWDFVIGTLGFQQPLDSVPQHLQQSYNPVRHGVPFLTPTGFRDMLVAEALVDPAKFCHRFNGFIRQAWTMDPETQWPFPREEIPLMVWPTQPDPDAVGMRDRVREGIQVRLGLPMEYGWGGG